MKALASTICSIRMENQIRLSTTENAAVKPFTEDVLFKIQKNEMYLVTDKRTHARRSDDPDPGRNILTYEAYKTLTLRSFRPSYLGQCNPWRPTWLVEQAERDDDVHYGDVVKRRLAMMSH